MLYSAFFFPIFLQHNYSFYNEQCVRISILDCFIIVDSNEYTKHLGHLQHLNHYFCLIKSLTYAIKQRVFKSIIQHV